MNEKSPLVSIILPTYNRDKFIRDAINSVMSQTYTNWELIIWIDGSTDQTVDIINTFHDSRIQYHYSSNHGKSYALNQAIPEANGQYIAFLDDDDQWSKDKLRTQVTVLEENPDIDVLFGNFQNLNLDSRIEGLGFEQNSLSFSNLEKVAINPKGYKIIKGLPQSLLLSNFIAFDTAIVRKNIFQKGNYYFDEQLRNCDDLEFWWRLSIEEFVFAYIDEILMRRIKPPNSLSSPSLANGRNYLLALDICRITTIQHHREDLLPFFKPAYLSCWISLIRQNAIMGNRKESLNAFRKSLQYGFSFRAIYLTLGALAGKKLIEVVRRGH